MRNSFLFSGLLLGTALTLAAAPPMVTVKEWFFTSRDHRENVDSPAVWHGPDGQHWLLATTKATHSLLVHDAVNGALLRRIGGEGEMPAQFNRPNGVWVIDDLALVVERDNRRVQVLHLPEFRPLTTFGETELINPYGLYVQPLAGGEYRVFVTDNYETPEGEVPPMAELGRRVQVYLLEVEGRTEGTAEAEWERSIGEKSGPGALAVVESIVGDPALDHLVIAEESMDAGGQCLKVYDFEGNFTGQLVGEGLFRGQAEGLALWEIGPETGYWIATDQGMTENWYHVFERETFAHVGSFRGEVTLNTDGIWFDPQPSLPRFPQGVFYGVHNDGNVAAFGWHEVVAALGLESK